MDIVEKQASLKTAHQLPTDALKKYAGQLVLKAVVPGLPRDDQAAKLYNDWGFAADPRIHRVSGALSRLFMEAHNAPPLMSHGTV